MGDGSKQCYVWAPDAAPSGHVSQRSTASGLRCHGTTICPALPCPPVICDVDPAAASHQRQSAMQVNRPAAGPPLNTVLPTTCYAQYRYASFWRYVRPRAAPWTPGAQIVSRPRPPAAPARTGRRSGGRVCAAWSGTVGAGARGRGPGWHGARSRHMSRTRPCGGWGGWTHRSLSAVRPRFTRLPCCVARPGVPCPALPASGPAPSLRRVPGGKAG